MRILKFLVPFCFLLITTVVQVSAQTGKYEPIPESDIRPNVFLDEAESLFKKAKYFEAIPYYKKAYSREYKRETQAEIEYKIADCYRLLGDSKNAEVYYDKAVKEGVTKPIAFLYLAEAQKSNANYSESLTNFKEYKSVVPTDPRGTFGVKSAELSKEWVAKPTRHIIENVNGINSKASDFNVSFSRRNPRILVFTSTREEALGKVDDGWTGQKFSDLFQTTRDDKGKYSTPIPLPGAVNTESNEGSSVFNAAGSILYFTRCEQAVGRNGYCGVYLSKKKGESWDTPKYVPLVDDTITIGHPCLAPEENAIFFSARMAGGYGGKDIYVCIQNSETGKWGKPINLGPKINTPGDEVYPSYDKDGNFYYSSDGLPGLGGLDIFKTKNIAPVDFTKFRNNPGDTLKSTDTTLTKRPALTFGNVDMRDSTVRKVDSLVYYTQMWAVPENLKYPMNSSLDDFGIIFETTGTNESGYFSSAREGGKGSDDIYSFRLPSLEFTIQGKVMDVDNRGGIKGATIELYGNDGSLVSVKTDKKGNYIFDKTMVKSNTSYRLTATCKDYFSAKGVQSTVGLKQNTDLFQDAFLLKTSLRPIVLPNILYDFNKATLRPESKIALDSLVLVMADNPKITIRIMSHTDSRASDAYNNELSQKRAQSVVDYLIYKGVDSLRLTAKGFGETRLKITDAEIAKLKTEAEREAAHQVNRRTEFEKVRDDYSPGKTKTITNTTYSDTTETGKVILFKKPMLSASDSVFFKLKESPVIVDPNKAQPIVPATVPAAPNGKGVPAKPVKAPVEPAPAKKDTVPADKKEPAPKKDQGDSALPE